MRPLRILHVTPYSGEAWAYGGIPRLADALARGLAARGHQVTVCTTDACDRSHRLPDGRGSADAASQSENAVTVRVFRNVSNRLAYDWQLFLPLGLSAYLRRSAGAFDVGHLHACRNVPGAIAAHHLRRAGVPYVLAPNGTAPRIERRRLAKRIFDAAIGTRMMRDASRVIAVSEAERAQLNTIGVPTDAIRTLPNPIDLDEFTPAPSPGRFRARLGNPTGPLVLFLGRLSPRKRLDVLVRAFALAAAGWRSNGVDHDARLVIAGSDMGAGEDARALAGEVGVGDRTIFTGLLRGRDRLDALADADVVVYASQDEIFGLVPLEAILCGTPVIVADDSGCGEVVRTVGGGRIVPVGDDRALAAAIQDVIDRRGFWHNTAITAAARVRAAYARDVVCARLDDVYRELVSHERPHARPEPVGTAALSGPPSRGGHERLKA